MEARQHLVEELFDGSYRFKIPVYQRNYEWGKFETEQFLDDIEKTMHLLREYRENEDSKFKKYTYFIGSIVTYSDKGTKSLLLIDGQQRTTTICLIFIALRDLLKSNRFRSKDETLSEQIDERLVNKFNKDENRLKLKPINRDFYIYKALVFHDQLNGNYKSSNVYNNYQIIKKRIENLCSDGSFTIDNFWEALTKLEFVWIELQYGTDNPQKIFESLNATGKKLEEGDLIRNYVLMNVHPENQDDYYIKYWRAIEENCQGQKLTDFLRYYLILKNTKYVNDKDVYKEFKITFSEFSDDILKNIADLSAIFKKIKNGDYDEELESDYLYILDFVKFGTSLSLQMQIMGLYEKKLLSKNQTNNCLALLESYFIRRKICGFPTNALNKIIPMIVKNLDGQAGEDYIKGLTKNLTDAKNKFPTNKDFIEALTKIDLYSTKNFCNYFLGRIEKLSNREITSSIQNIIHNLNISKEHIFPQDSLRWKKDMSDVDYNYLKDEKLHSLANLTLTAYNGELSNKPWHEKREIFTQSAYTTLNNMLKNYENWNRETLLKREKILIEKALDIWQRPIENAQHVNINLRIISFDDDPTHTRPQRLSWNNKEISVKNWDEVFIKVIGDIYDSNPEKFSRLVKQGEFGRIVSFNSEIQTKPYQLDDDIFIELDQSVDDIFSNLRKIIKCFDEFDIDDVLIEISSETADIDMVA